MSSRVLSLLLALPAVVTGNLSNSFVSTTQHVVTIQHITFPTNNRSFTDTKAAIESSLPLLNTTFKILLDQGDIAGARAALEVLPPLSIFLMPPRDFGSLVQIFDQTGRKAVQYDIGNPYLAATMAQYELGVALYAPVRVLLREVEYNGRDLAAFEYDLPTSTFGQFGNPRVDETAQRVSDSLRDALAKAGGWTI